MSVLLAIQNLRNISISRCFKVNCPKYRFWSMHPKKVSVWWVPKHWTDDTKCRELRCLRLYWSVPIELLVAEWQVVVTLMDVMNHFKQSWLIMRPGYTIQHQNLQVIPSSHQAYTFITSEKVHGPVVTKEICGWNFSDCSVIFTHWLFRMRTI